MNDINGYNINQIIRDLLHGLESICIKTSYLDKNFSNYLKIYFLISALYL